MGLGFLYFTSAILLLTGGLLYRRDYAPYYELPDFFLIGRVIRPRNNCDLENHICYDGIIYGNYTRRQSSGDIVIHHCENLVVTQLLEADAWESLLQKYPTVGPMVMWSSLPDQDNFCVTKVDSHYEILSVGAALALIALLITIVLIVRQNVKHYNNNNNNSSTNPSPLLRY
jgi:hypothetical protein